MRERAHEKSDKGISGAAALAVKIDCRAAANVIYLSNCLIKLKGGDKSREKIIDTCKIMR